MKISSGKHKNTRYLLIHNTFPISGGYRDTFLWPPLLEVGDNVSVLCEAGTADRFQTGWFDGLVLQADERLTSSAVPSRFERVFKIQYSDGSSEWVGEHSRIRFATRTSTKRTRKHSEAGGSCAICLEDLRSDCSTTKCGHSFCTV